MFSNRRRGVTGAAVLLALALLASCGDDTAEQDSTSSARTPEQVAALLVEPEALGQGWSTLTDPSGEFDFEGGVVTDDNRDKLPRFEDCPATADSQQGQPATLHWDAFRQLNLDTGTPQAPPSPGTRPQHHLVFVQEFLLSDDPASVTDSYEQLRSGMEDCLGREATTKDGEKITSEPLAVPDVGEAATGLRYAVTEPGGGGGAVWDLRTVAFRDGDLLAALTIAEITTPQVKPVLDEAAFEDIVRTAADALS